MQHGIKKLIGRYQLTKKSRQQKHLYCFLSNWVTVNIPKMMPTSNESKELMYEYPEAPEIIILDEEEKFRDNNGKIYEIETRGAKNSKDIYFLASDIAEVF